jgi:hypothetical protein
MIPLLLAVRVVKRTSTHLFSLPVVPCSGDVICVVWIMTVSCSIGAYLNLGETDMCIE